MGTWTYYGGITPPSQSIKQTFTQSIERRYYDQYLRYDEYNDYTVTFKFDNFRLNNDGIYCDYTIGVDKKCRRVNKDTGATVIAEFEDSYFDNVIFMGGLDILHNEETIAGVPFPVKLGATTDTQVTLRLVAEYRNYLYYSRLDERVTPQTDYWDITVTIPSFVEIVAPTLNSFQKQITLGANGYYDYSFNVANPAAISYTLKHDSDTLVTTTTATTKAVSYRWRIFPDNSSSSYKFNLNFTYPGHTKDYEYWYFTDQEGKYHNDLCGALKTDTIEYNFEISDNPSILLINNSTVVSSSSYKNVDIDIYSVENTKFKLVYNFTYNDITDTTTNGFRIRLINGGNPNQVFIDKYISGGSPFPRTLSGTFYSEIFTQSAEVSPVVEITPYRNNNNSSYNNRKTEKVFPNVTIYAYQHPKISFFDVFPSTPSGDSDLTSPHATYLAQYEYAPCGNWNRITAQKIDIYLESDESTIIQTYNNPGLVSGTSKYIADITYDIHKNYIVVLTIEDRFGRTTTKRAILKYSGGVIMDFNKTGYGMAIGKYSESDVLEINLPTIFYNDVEYISGRRLTTDTARDLGCSDPYNVGATNIQAMLDYLVNKVLNG